MKEYQEIREYRDIAIPIAWPDQTARGDEAWMAFMKRVGLVKNLNFRVGHAAIVLVHRASGQLKYFDFGRYITPRGYGRARSSAFDPRLTLETKAQFEENTDQLLNFEEILHELETKQEATHGGGRLICSICPGISFELGTAYAEKLVDQGPIPYGALAQNNNSCSRYVAQIMVASMRKRDPRIRAILYPEFFKASPMSNVVNGASSKNVFCYLNSELSCWQMGRNKSLFFQLNLLRDNFSNKGSLRLPDDSYPGQIGEPTRAINIPPKAQWLGGIGEGKWFVLVTSGNDLEEGLYAIERYDVDGRLEYRVACQPDSTFDPYGKFEFTFDIHFHKHVLRQNNREITFHSVKSESAALSGRGYGNYAMKS